MSNVPQPLSSLRRPDAETDAYVSASMGHGCHDDKPMGCPEDKPTGCQTECEKPACGRGWSWGMGLLWFIIIAVIVWFIIYASKPSWIYQTDCHGNKTDQINYGALLVATIVIAIIVMIILWILWSAFRY